MLADRIGERYQQSRRPSHQSRQSGAFELDALTSVDLTLSVQGLMITILCRVQEYAEELHTEQQKRGIYKRLQGGEFGIVSRQNRGGGLRPVGLMNCWQRKISLRSTEGPLSPILESYSTSLNEEGYSHESFLGKTWFVIRFSRWLRQRHIEMAEVTLGVGQRFLRDKPYRRGDPTTLRHFLLWMHSRGLISAQALQPREKSEVDTLVEEYSAYLLSERGLAATSAEVYAAITRRFLTRTCPRGRSDLRALTAARIRDFAIQEARRFRTSKAASLLTCVVRAFLRFVHYRGYVDRPLVGAVPAVAHWSMASVPRALPLKAVRRVLTESRLRRSACGLRDRAILLVLARLGLRAREVMLLELDDIDWVNACIHVCGKERQERPLPLPHDVGEAIAAYLRKGRPASSCRRVFLRTRAPWRGVAKSSSISAIVGRALMRAQVMSATHGAHQFRHSLATNMLRQGASLTEIAQVMRHRDPNTTRIYAKVDLNALREVALPWPGKPL
jgi:site-specific recombinase XerD